MERRVDARRERAGVAHDASRPRRGPDALRWPAPAPRALRPAAGTCASVSGTERMTPIGARVSAVIPACAQISRYFSQRTRVMSVATSAATPAAVNAARRRSRRGLARPSSSPNASRPPSRWTMTPGASIAANTHATPPTACPAPRLRASASSLSTPFCSDTTAVSGPIAGRMRLGRRGRVERLHAEEDDVDGRQLARVVRRVDLDRPFAVGRRAHAQPVAPDRIQVRPAGQEAHRHAGPGQPRAEEPTHPTGADHEHAHHHHPRCLK